MAAGEEPGDAGRCRAARLAGRINPGRCRAARLAAGINPGRCRAARLAGRINPGRWQAGYRDVPAIGPLSLLPAAAGRPLTL